LSVSIAVDAMGGDHAPGVVVRGAVRAAQEFSDLELVLVGPEGEVRRALDETGWRGDSIRIQDAPEVIGMGESPIEALRKKRRSSIAVALANVQQGAARAFVSAGNTGACVAAAQLLLRPLEGVKRPGILVTITAGEKPFCVCDVGANIQPRPEHLAQYGVMSSVFTRKVLGVPEPNVGLLNVGEEEAKGNDLVKTARSLCETALSGTSNSRFHGYIEGDELFSGICDVVVCDGFSGNVLLKVSEGLAERLSKLIGEALMGSVKRAAADPVLAGQLASLVKGTLGELRSTIDYSEFGGAPLLGVDGTVIIAHGRSDPNAIFNALRVARRMVETNVNAEISERLAR
jgi:glycerol-3-phosphate acyltransferase PlsX